jgi:hypothetical protein
VSAPEEVAGGIWRWTARHPTWHPGDFGAEVASFALRRENAVVLVDPLLAPGEEAALDALLDGRPPTVVITIPYHARSAAAMVARHGGEVLGHPGVAKRLPAGTPFRAVAPGDPLPHGMTVHAIGSPRRSEQPVALPWAGALAFGDAIVGVDGRLRVWIQQPVDEARLRWYENRLVPTLEPLLALGCERVLVTHGAPVVSGGTAALRDALAAGPWYHRG